MNVDEWMQEAETLGVHELPRSSSSLSMRTDASGHGEHASSDSFYDSGKFTQTKYFLSSKKRRWLICFYCALDNTDAEAPPAPAAASTIKAQVTRDEDDDSSIADSDEDEPVPAAPAQQHHEEPKMEEFANWDDPTSVDWGNEEAARDTSQESQSDTTASAPPSGEQVFKCTACK